MHNRTGFLALVKSLLLMLVMGISACGGGGTTNTPDPNGVRPTITSITPAQGTVGTQITINGLNFGDSQGQSSVTLGDVTFNIDSWSDTQIVVTIAPGMSSGLIVVLVNGLVSQSGTQAQLFIPSRPLGPPILNTLNPDFGRVGTDSITLVGENFGDPGSGSVLFTTQGGGTVAANVVTQVINGVSVRQWSDTSIGVFVPATAVTGPVLVQTAQGASNTKPFTALPAPDGLNDPVITSVTSNDENIGIGSVVSIFGDFFGNKQGGSTITLNGLNLQVINWTSTRIDATIPAGAVSGSIEITVGGKTAISSPLVVGNRPVITGVSPSQIKIGQPVTIFGNFFGAEQGSGTLNVGGKVVPVTSWSNNQITVSAMVPVTAGSNNSLSIVVTSNTGLVSVPFTASLTTNLKGSFTVSPTAGVVGVTNFSFLIEASGGSDDYSYELISDKAQPSSSQPAVKVNPVSYTYKTNQLGTADQKVFATAMIITDNQTQERITVDGPSVLVVGSTQPVITQIAVGNFNRGVDAPNDWIYIGSPASPDYHNFTFFQNQTTFASNLYQLIDQGSPVARFSRNEAAYKYNGSDPHPYGYRYNPALGSETAPGSIVRLTGMNFGFAQGSVVLNSAAANAFTIPANDFVDWQDTFVEFRLPSNQPRDLSGTVKLITATAKEFTSTENLICSPFVSGVSPSNNVDPGGSVGFGGFDFTPPVKTGMIGTNTFLFWVIRANYTNPFTAAPETGLALVTTPFAADSKTSNLITFNMSRLDNVMVEVFNLSGTASAVVPASQAGGGDYFCFIWSGAIAPFSAGGNTVANSGILSQAITVNVGTGGGSALSASLQASAVNVNTGVPITFNFSASGGTPPYTNFEIDFDDGSPLFTSGTAGSTNHAYGLAGTYTVVLTVTDSVAGTDTAQVVINVSGGPPPP
jgi:hypothetical protein